MRRRQWFHAAAAAAASASLPLASAPGAASAASSTRFDPPFPRLMGMNIGAKNYHEPAYQAQLARYQVLALDFFPGWRSGRGSANPIRDALRAIKARNPDILIGQYSTLVDVPLQAANKVEKMDAEGWWLFNSRHERQRPDPQYDTYDANITEWAPVDEQGRRYPEWAAEQEYRLFHQQLPEIGFWYLDNSTSRPLVKRADWDRDGRDETNTDPRIARAWRAGHLRGWQRIRKLEPSAWLVANSDDITSPEYSGQLNGAYMEALYGKLWSLGNWGGWDKVMGRYRATMRNAQAPRLVGFGVVGAPEDFRLMRLGLCSCLMDDGYFSYATLERQYSTAPWFDEFDAGLGAALDPPPQQAWQGPVYRRRFEHGMALVNPSMSSASVDVGAGWQRLDGRQDRDVNNGRPVSRLSLAAGDGIVLRRAD
jgi:hypothetical protein